jgi:phosphoglycerol transferase MdoB-like AlkP superfamily enzyme
MKPLYRVQKTEEIISNGTAIFRIVSITIINVLFMSFAFVMGAAGTWQSAGEGVFLVACICFAPILVSLVLALIFYNQEKMHKAISVVKWVIPSFFLIGLGLIVFGAMVRYGAEYLGVQPPCAFRWPPCDQ